jgi:hypothetical protein
LFMDSRRIRRAWSRQGFGGRIRGRYNRIVKAASRFQNHSNRQRPREDS